MRSIVARGVNFGMLVAYMVSAEQRTIETVASMDISHSDICLNTPYFLRCEARHRVSGAVGCTTSIYGDLNVDI